MFPPFPTETAYHYCITLKHLLDEGYLKMNQVTRLSVERMGQKVMLGTLVCLDEEGNRIVLCTNSGISKKIVLASDETKTEWFQNGIRFILVPPIVSAAQIDEALRKNDAEIHELTGKIDSLKQTIKTNSGSDFQSDLETLKQKRKLLCDESLEGVRKLYRFNTISHSQFSIFNYQLPTGTGDCCEPKLFHYAFAHNLKPFSLAQIFTNESELIPPCDERCGILLPEMLGLEVLYMDKHIVVVNKPSGLLSVPGRGEDKQDCVVNRVKKLYSSFCKIEQPSVHRLDMETSGILILGFTEEAHRNLSLQFEKGEVHKEYTALLSGVLEKQGTGECVPKHGEKEGVIKLKFRLDPENRPYQIYDEIYGKEGVTRWKNEGVVWYQCPDGSKLKATKIRFFPETGRTHQLRLASSDSHGFGLPIIGDSLYGTCSEGQRLMLHAEKIIFYHPVNGRKLTFVCPSKF